MAAHQEVRAVELPTGRLTVEVHSTDIPLDDLVGFAARYNKKRGFLFASKVLGKHISAPPSVIRNVHTRLAAKIPDLPGPVLFIGMAETAIALGNGVFDRFVEMTGREDVAFVQSTRYLIDANIALRFEEEHSHASAHIIYEPPSESLKYYMRNARSVVLIDDEASTGKTIYNLLAAIKDVLPGIEQAVSVVITDWRGLEKTGYQPDYMPLPTFPVAILHGQFSFTPASDLVNVAMPPAVGNGEYKGDLLKTNFGRLGLEANAQCLEPDADRWVRLGWHLSLRPGQNGRNRVLVLGTGEFAYPPFLLAEHLERMGLDVRYQSTTRSPIMPGLAIEERLVFQDNYDDGILNYVYNVRRENYDHIIIVHETPESTLDKTLTEGLGAMTLYMV